VTCLACMCLACIRHMTSALQLLQRTARLGLPDDTMCVCVCVCVCFGGGGSWWGRDDVSAATRSCRIHAFVHPRTSCSGSDKQ
jgi:hypothetical protein